MRNFFWKHFIILIPIVTFFNLISCSNPKPDPNPTPIENKINFRDITNQTDIQDMFLIMPKNNDFDYEGTDENYSISFIRNDEIGFQDPWYIGIYLILDRNWYWQSHVERTLTFGIKSYSGSYTPFELRTADETDQYGHKKFYKWDTLDTNETATKFVFQFSANNWYSLSTYIINMHADSYQDGGKYHNWLNECYLTNIQPQGDDYEFCN